MIFSSIARKQPIKEESIIDSKPALNSVEWNECLEKAVLNELAWVDAQEQKEMKPRRSSDASRK